MITELLTDNIDTMFFPSQCSCGHLYLEQYKFSKLTEQGFIGFCWCGFCKTKNMIKPIVKTKDQ